MLNPDIWRMKVCVCACACVCVSVCVRVFTSNHIYTRYPQPTSSRSLHRRPVTSCRHAHCSMLGRCACCVMSCTSHQVAHISFTTVHPPHWHPQPQPYPVLESILINMTPASLKYYPMYFMEAYPLGASTAPVSMHPSRVC